MNKALAGYRMLMLLSNADGKVTTGEGSLIRDYLKKTLPPDVDLEEEEDFLGQLDPSDYFIYFSKAMDEYYKDSTAHERAGFIDFAVKIVKADDEITKEENILLEELLNGWEPDGE
ncbi:MAG: hypothetical protein ABIT08_03635 [Bacteroidia bacterium]